MLAGVWAFLAAYALLVAGATLLVAAVGYDPITSISTALTVVGNVGPGLGQIGPLDNFAHFPAGVKLLLCGCLVAGRLELFTLMVLFSGASWRR